MNPSALRDADNFFKTYVPYKKQATPRLVDIGAQDVNGSMKQVCPKHVEYVGVDFVEGKGVDVVLEDPYSFPFEKDLGYKNGAGMEGRRLRHRAGGDKLIRTQAQLCI